jgi:Barstar (barnase inhibitor)
MVVRLDCDRITDGGSFHTVFAEVFGFPDFYGRNMHAWIDCMGDVDTPETGMTTLTVPPGRVLTLHLDGVDNFAARCPEQFAALVECAAFVNWRRSSQGGSAVLALSYYKQAESSAAVDPPKVEGR